jgi:hypothetical protein
LNQAAATVVSIGDRASVRIDKAGHQARGVEIVLRVIFGGVLVGAIDVLDEVVNWVEWACDVVDAKRSFDSCVPKRSLGTRLKGEVVG